MIPELPPFYVDHLVSPRGQEDLPLAEAAGETGSMVGGMGVRVTLTWRAGHDGEAIIRAAGVRAFGSPAALPPSSYLAEYVTGMTPEAAQEIRPDDLLQALAGAKVHVLPEPVRRGALLAIGALHCALGLPGCRPADLDGSGILVCRCLSVGDRQIRRAVAEGARTPEEIGELCGAGTGCRSCRPDLLLLLHEERMPPPARPPKDLHPLARVVLARAGPVLASRGLGLRDVRVTNDGVRLSLGKPRRGASISVQGALAEVRHLLQETVGGSIPVGVNGTD